MQTVSPKLHDNIIDMLIEFVRDKNAGAFEAINGYVYIRRATWNELQGVFTKQEASALVSVYNNKILLHTCNIKRKY